MYKYLAVALVAMACAGPTKVSDFTEDPDEYTVLQGVLERPAERENGGDRLIIYLNTGAEVLTCVVENDHNETLLKTVQAKINQNSDLEIVLFGKKVDHGWFEYLDGIDVELLAISYYPYTGGKRQVVLLSFGTRFGDVMRSVSWKNFLLKVGEKAAKAAL